MFGLIVTSLIPADVGGRRLGKCGRLLSSSVKTDWKYSMSRLALSISDVIKVPDESWSGAMPWLLLNLLLTNLKNAPRLFASRIWFSRWTSKFRTANLHSWAIFRYFSFNSGESTVLSLRQMAALRESNFWTYFGYCLGLYLLLWRTNFLGTCISIIGQMIFLNCTHKSSAVKLKPNSKCQSIARIWSLIAS